MREPTSADYILYPSSLAMIVRCPESLYPSSLALPLRVIRNFAQREFQPSGGISLATKLIGASQSDNLRSKL